MQVLVNSDHTIHGGEDLTDRIQGVVAGTLARFEKRVTRVEVHLSDLNGQKIGERDKRCLMEARVGGLKPIAVSHEAYTMTEAIHAAADKLERALDRAVGRMQDTAGRMPAAEEIVSVEELQALVHWKKWPAALFRTVASLPAAKGCDACVARVGPRGTTLGRGKRAVRATFTAWAASSLRQHKSDRQPERSEGRGR